ncbi:MAG: kelch repeat-containing protein [Acidobacteriota bacterium]
MLVIVLTPLPGLSSSSLEASAAVSTYGDRATFLAAAGATTTIDFSTNDAALPITNPPSDVSFNLFVRSGVIFQDIHSYFDLFIYTFPKAVIRVNLPPGTTTVGTDIGPFNQGAGTYEITLSTGDTFQLSNNGSVQFFGAIGTTSIQWVDFSLDGASLMLDNFAFGAGPSQGWNATSPMPTSRFGAGAVRLQSGKVLVVGGHSGVRSGFRTEAEIFEPESGSWTSTSPLPSAHRLSATLLGTGEVLVVGDDPFGSVIPTDYLYGEASATWTPAGPPSRVRYSPVVTVLPSGDVLMAGGYNGQCCSGPTGTFNTAELYNRSSNSWTPTAAMAETRISHTATLLTSAKVLVTGGLIRDPVTPHNSAEIYDPVTHTWLRTGSMSTPRFFHTATLLPSGKVLVIGGFLTFSTALASAEIYDPASGAWSPTAPMSVARGNHTATLLPSGGVLVAGGENDSEKFDSTEIYDPASGAWSNAGRMINARKQHTATLLSSGLVLLAGGVGASGNDIASAEVWQPANSLALTPQQSLGNLNYSVLTLVASGRLNDSEASSPISKLQTAIRKLNKGNPQAACKQLKKFVNQVNALVTAGTLTPSVGQDLIEAALRVKDTIGC